MGFRWISIDSHRSYTYKWCLIVHGFIWHHASPQMDPVQNKGFSRRPWIWHLYILQLNRQGTGLASRQKRHWKPCHGHKRLRFLTGRHLFHQPCWLRWLLHRLVHRSLLSQMLIMLTLHLLCNGVWLILVRFLFGSLARSPGKLEDHSWQFPWKHLRAERAYDSNGIHEQDDPNTVEKWIGKELRMSKNTLENPKATIIKIPVPLLWPSLERYPII